MFYKEKVGEKPFCYEKLVEVLNKEYNYDLGDPTKCVMIGDKLTSDILFGNMNGMASIYLWKF